MLPMFLQAGLKFPLRLDSWVPYLNKHLAFTPNKDSVKSHSMILLYTL